MDYIKQLDDILDDMVNHAKKYELCGVEFVPEDALYVVEKMDNGSTYDQALNEVMSGIRNCLNEGQEYETPEFYDDDYFGDIKEEHDEKRN